MEELKNYTPSEYDRTVRQPRKERELRIRNHRGKGISFYMHPDILETLRNKNQEIFLIPIIDENHKIGFVNLAGEMKVEPRFDEINGTFRNSESIVAVRIGDFWNVIDTNGHELLPAPTKNKIFPSIDSRMITVSPKFIMNVDDEKSKISYDRGVVYIDAFRYGFARIHKKGGWGIINTSGKEVLPAVYYEVFDFIDFPQATSLIRRTKDARQELISLYSLDK